MRGRHSYRVVERLGAGAFAVVYLAERTSEADDGTPRLVALKALRPHLAHGRALRGLSREMSALLAVDSPRVPRAVDWSLDATRPFVAMPYYAHGTLQQLLGATHRLDSRQAGVLLTHLLEALVAAHQAGVLHLDVKPANVLLDGRGGYALTDFGVSHAIGGGSGGGAKGLGSPGYQAPEQAERATEHFDIRTDLFGVGATAWSALTGVDLSTPEGLALRAIQATSPFTLPPVTAQRPEVDPNLATLVMSLLARAPGDRPGSAGQAMEMATAFLAGAREAAPTAPGEPVPMERANELLASLVDPVVARVFRDHAHALRRVRDGEFVTRQGERSQLAFVLLKGCLRVERHGVVVARLRREGEVVGEVSAFAGGPRIATIWAEGDVVLRVLNAAELEQLVVLHPALAVRLIRSMADRLSEG